MRHRIYSRLLAPAALFSSALMLFLAQISWAAPGFDLDLKELKKPSQPTAPKKAAPPRKKKSEAKATPKKQPAIADAKPAVKQPEIALTPLPQPVPEQSELILHRGDNACQLAERIAVALARTVPTESLLNGLVLKPVATVNHGQLDLMVTCGLQIAEAYTYSRLLEEHQVELVNIRGDETAGQTAQKIIDALALSYQQEQVEKELDGSTRIYLFPADAQRQRPLRLVVQP
ncbi:hypothetical protein SAMN02745119_01447 [Trichlorobacter thiogenes]|uniref:Uncharacterized protein n=1 Tax=Trichlorobacter thiogenes TaxID=115783 RepID=A0A1T4MYK1_9BACT|nr:hypothetical protein [Trichlorobacter thiogenes]SJZ71924.1 hypothetical protein SAMN02745119_01447 [Trichlorobacter thiogenes]